MNPHGGQQDTDPMCGFPSMACCSAGHYAWNGMKDQ